MSDSRINLSVCQSESILYWQCIPTQTRTDVQRFFLRVACSAMLRINDESTAKQTLQALETLACVGVPDKAEALCCAILALFNGRRFVARFHKQIVSKFQRSGQLLGKEEVLHVFNTLIEEIRKPAQLFTSSFDRRQANQKADNTRASRAQKVRKFNIKKALKGGPNRTAVSRKELQLSFAQKTPWRLQDALESRTAQRSEALGGV